MAFAIVCGGLAAGLLATLVYAALLQLLGVREIRAVFALLRARISS